MDLSFFVRGLLIGFSIAATVGPMCVLCIQRTLYKGQICGLVSGLGIATADAVYCSIAAFGLTLLTNFLVSQQVWIRLVGGLFLIYLGFKTVFTKPAVRAAAVKTTANSYFGAYASTFVLTTGINLLRRKFSSRWLLGINRISGVIIMLFGILALLSLTW